MVNKESVGKAIAKQRKEKGMNQKELAEKLHVSCQAVSKWEVGKSLPTVEILSDIAELLEVTVDYLLNSEGIETRDICYQDTGLDTVSLYEMKDRLDLLITRNRHIVEPSCYIPLIYTMDMKNMEKPLFVTNSFVPGSKARLAREFGKDREICQDLAAKAINNMIRFGVTPVVFRANIVCGNKSHEQIGIMAQAFKEICEEQGVDYGGFSISAQPINYLPDEYELSATISGIVDEKDLIKGDEVQDGDILVALYSEGLEATSIPFVRVMLERNRTMAMDKIDEEHYFIDEALKPNQAYRWIMEKLHREGFIHAAYKVSNSFLHPGPFDTMPEEYYAEINLDTIRVTPLYEYLHHLDMVGERFLPHRFNVGVSMILAVPRDRKKEVLKMVNEEGQGYVIGQIRKVEEGQKDKIKVEGKIQWK